MVTARGKARAMPDIGSLREIGQATLGVDKNTKARLKVLAGDTPLCAKVRELVEAEELRQGGSSGIPLPGQERLVSENTISAMSAKLSRLEAMVSGLVIPPEQIKTFTELLQAMAAGKN